MSRILKRTYNVCSGLDLCRLRNSAILSFLISKVPLVMRSGILPSVSGPVQLDCASRFAGRIPMEVPPMPTTDQRAEGCGLQEQAVPGGAGMDVALLGVCYVT